jgi:acyl-CoA synthetase (AMP-forming)/AMP-acid ligase II
MLYSLLSKTVENNPDNLAVICGDIRYNYRQLKERVDRLAGGLRSIGIERNDKIAIISKNCHRFLETYFAAAGIEAILVPVNHRLAAGEHCYILKNSGAKTLITHPDILKKLSENKEIIDFLENVILTEGEVGLSLKRPSTNYESLLDKPPIKEDRASLIEESAIAQIYYTSGTTGKPKGVILTHKNNFIHAERTIKELDLTQADRWLHVSPMFHLADAWAVWSITKAAAVHVMIPHFEPGEVLKTMENHGVTLSNFIPTMLNILVNTPNIKSFKSDSLRLILSGGAPIAKEVIRKVIDLFGCEYIQTYGLTETSPFLTMSILKDKMKALPFEKKLKYMATTGRAFCDVELKVVKDNGNEVIPNEKDVGEIVVKSETVTPGYWQLPEETSSRILNGWLRTRDLAVIDEEGYVTIIDRKDDVIITGGENVYSIEVEDVLYSHPDILEAAVIGLPDSIWGEKVTAVVVPKKGKRFHSKDVVSFCRDKMAPFKAPKKVIFTDHLPKTGSAKIYKYKLREMYRDKGG